MKRGVEIVDLSSKNIEMCWKATELQDIFKCTTKYTGMHTGHFIAWKYKDDPEHYMHSSVLEVGIEYDWQRKCLFTPGTGHGSHLPENYQVLDYDWAWIPRLDQLFDMLSGTSISKIDRLYKFGTGTEISHSVNNTQPFKIFPSSEQLALALVMYENYQKVWCKSWINFKK